MRSDDYPKAKSGATTAASQSGATSETAAAGRRGGATCAICCATTGTGFVTTGGTVGAHILGAARTALGLCDATHTDTLSFGTGALGKLDVLGGDVASRHSAPTSGVAYSVASSRGAAARAANAYWVHVSAASGACSSSSGASASSNGS